MSKKSFAHLHVHATHSQLDGHSKHDELVAAARADGQTGISLTDHGNLHGLVDMYKECAKHDDIKFIPGIEAYFCDDRFVKETIKQENANGLIDGSDKRYYHLTLLAENNIGYHNLLKISSDAFINGAFYKPRTDWSMLEGHSEGLIATTGCLGGVVLQKLLHGDTEGATAAAARLQDIFGRDNLFIELMNHNIPEQLKTNPQLIEISKRLNAPLVATNDSHYTKKEHHTSHDALLCCQVGAQISDTDRFRFHGEEHYLKSAAEMRSLFSETESACDNTLWIANRSNVTLDFKTLHLPKFPVPEGYKDDNEFLIELVSKGLKIRYGDNPSEEVYDRAAYELSVIQSLNLSSYFLIFWDIVNFTKRERILTGPGRGSSAGSIVAYALEITKVEPLKHDLIFERFINPDRVALADIDYDVTSADRDKIVQYVRDTYGQEYVAQVITFSKIKARSAVRDAARVLGYKPAKGNDIVKVMPPLIMGVSTPLHACFTKEPQYEAGYANAQGLRELYESDPDTKEIVDVALGLEGLVRQDGVHAAGTVIGDRPLVELVPLQQRKNKDGTLGPIVTQYEKNTIEELGLLKMDFLALKNLDIIKQCLDYMGEELEYLDTMTYDDLETYAMLRRGEGIAVFQVESGPMRQLMIRLAPTDIGDIAAILALYRPGPMAANMHNDYADRKNGRQAISYFHPDAKPILEKYQGLMYFQESVMQVAQKFAGYSASEADNLRKIMGKKLPEKMKAEKEKFVNGCNATGYSQIGESLFHLIEAFASYGFPAGHAFGYAYITYWTAYLKCHFPREYMAAVCSGCMEGSDSLDKTARYLGETRRMGMKVYPPDLNSSNVGYSVAEDGIRIGLGTLAHMSIDTVQKLIEIRDEKPFDGLYDFAFRVNPNVQAFRSLAYSGALDTYGTRQGIATTADEILKISRKDKKKANQINLFDVEEVVDFNIPTTEYGWHELLNREKETMGIFASGHPLDSYTEEKTNRDILTIQESEDNKVHDVLVIVTDVKTKYTKAQKAMATVTIEDQTGAVEMVMFPKSWEDYGSFMVPGRILKVTLKTGTDFRDERNYVMMSAEEVESQIAQANMVKQFGVYLPKGYNSDPKRMSALKGVLLQNHGNVLADIYISRSTKLNLGNEYLVNPTQKLKDEINNLFVQYKEVN
jgi:DNA polymerase-3 subunit alpha